MIFVKESVYYKWGEGLDVIFMSCFVIWRIYTLWCGTCRGRAFYVIR